MGANKKVLDIIIKGRYNYLFFKHSNHQFSAIINLPQKIMILSMNVFKTLSKQECDIETSEIPTIVSPLSVNINSSRKKCIILDLRYVNPH